MAGIRAKQFMEDTFDATEVLRVFSDTTPNEAFTKTVVDAIFSSSSIVNAKLLVNTSFDANSQQIINVADGTAAGHAINKGQLDAAISGLSWKDSAVAATTQDLESESFGGSGVTYSNGTAGLGATLTQDVAGDGAFGSLDSVSISQGDRILVKNQSTAAENGIYYLSEAGDGASTPWVLTRATDSDVANELVNATLFIEQGSTYGDTGWTQTASGLTVGSSNITFVQFTGGGGLSAGNGITIGGSVISIDVDSETGGNIQPANLTANGVGIDINAIAGTGIEADGSANLRLSAQGNGIAGGAGSTLSVQSDGTTGGNIAPISVTSNGVGLDVSTIAGDGVIADGSGNLTLNGKLAVVKFPVRVATTTNGTLATAYEDGDTVDGVTIATGDRILLKDQSTATENGIYIVQASGPPSRSLDMPSGYEAHQVLIPVAEGTANGDKIFRVDADVNAATVGTDNLVFTAFGVDVSSIAGDGLVENSGALDVNTGAGIEVVSNAVRLSAQGPGITGGAGSVISVLSNTSDAASGIVGVDVSVNGVGVDVNDIDGNGLSTSTNTLVVQPDSTTGGDTVPVSVGANGVGLDVSSIAGTGLVADGSGALDIDTTSTVDFSSDEPTWTFNNETTAKGLFVSGTPVDANHVVNKTYVDNLISGLTWQQPVITMDFVGNASVATINGLTLAGNDAGRSYLVTDSGTIISGSVSVTAGDIVEWDGTQWVLIHNTGTGFPDNGIRVVLSTLVALVSPYTDSTDDGKIVTFDGTTVDGSGLMSTPDDGWAVLVDAENSYHENNGFVFDGSVPTGSWVKFTGTGQINAGTGLTKTGNTLNVGDAGRGVQVNADNVEISASEASFATGGIQASSNSWQFQIKTHSGEDGRAITTSSSGISVDGDDLSIDYEPTFYVPDNSGTGASDNTGIAALFKGIDSKFELAGGQPVNEAITAQNITGTDTALTDTLSYEPMDAGTGYMLLFLNGILQKRGAGNDYTVSGTTITWLASSGTAVDLDTSDMIEVLYTSQSAYV